MTFKLLRQVLIVGLSVAVIFLFIQPKLGELRELQGEVQQYDNAIKNATEFTNLLRSQLNQIEAIDPADERALNTFLPNELDPIVVSRDIQTIGQQNRLLVQSITYTESITDQSVRAVQDPAADGTDDLGTVAPTVVRTPVTVSVQGEYEDFVRFLRTLEANVYPLRVVNVEIGFADQSDDDTAVIGEPNGTYTVTAEALSIQFTL